MASKAENLTFPFRSGDTGNTPVAYYDCNSTSQAHAIPAEWYGEFVILTNDSANAAQFFISDDPDSTCDETVAAGNPTRAADLGGVILGNTSRQARLPYPSQATPHTGAKTYYLVRASAADATLRMELAEQ
jgi:hypothetical protein